MKSWEHYAEAERQIEYAEQAGSEGMETRHLLCAQVHATLALAGATALQAYSGGDEPELDEWQAAAGGEG